MKLDFLNPKYYFVQQLLTYLIITSFPFLFMVIPLVVAIFSEHGKDISSILEMICYFIGGAFLIAGCASFFTKEMYKRAHFKILEDRVEYFRDFVTLRITDLKYKNVKEMTLTQGPLQKVFGLGTILLQSHASPQSYKGGSSGLKIYNIENPKEVFSFLKKKIDNVEERI